MKNQNSEVGSRILKKRSDLGYSREKLAELSDISVQFLSDIEKGKKSMTVATLRKISAALFVTTDYIVNGTQYDDDYSDILTILDTLSPENKIQAKKLLITLSETIRINSRDK